MNKIIICFGTRPELIKLAPLIWKIKKSELADHLIVINTNQHKHTMCTEVLDIKVDYNLDVFTPNQGMSQLLAKISSRLDLLLQQLKEEQQDIRAIIAQGDTLTTLGSAQTAFLNQIPFYHIEAGLRSGDTYSPFPEEFNRKVVSMISKLHFAPSELEKENLMNEGVPNENIEVVGNTINDILKHYYEQSSEGDRNVVLISIHRKENQNDNLNLILKQITPLIDQYSNLEFIWLLHPTPYITKNVLKQNLNISVRPNVPYPELVKLYRRCKLVITDSGGIMEESAFLGIPRIIVRTDNERKGLLNLSDTFIHVPKDLNLKDCIEKALDAKGINSFIYGSGNSSERILTVLKNELKLIPTKPKMH